MRSRHALPDGPYSLEPEKTLEDEIEDIIEGRKHVFCPVINSMCRIDCEAFELPVVKVVREEPPAHSYISGGVCTHAELKHETRASNGN